MLDAIKNRNIALRKAEKDEEKKAREKIMLKVNADKVIDLDILLYTQIEN